MSLKKYLQVKGSTMDVLASAGTIGLHMVSGPIVGFAIGYGLDYWLGTSPWFKLIFFIIGIAAGFKNVYDDSQRLLRKIQVEDDQRRGIIRDAAGNEVPMPKAVYTAGSAKTVGSPKTIDDTDTPDNAYITSSASRADNAAKAQPKMPTTDAAHAAAEFFAAEQKTTEELKKQGDTPYTRPRTPAEAEQIYTAVLRASDAPEDDADNYAAHKAKGGMEADDAAKP